MSEPSETLGTDEGGDTETIEDNEEINSGDSDDDETEMDDDDV